MEVRQFHLPLETPLETARGFITEREGFLVTVEYEGVTGLGEATPLPGWTESYDECREALDRAQQVAAELDWGVALAKLDAPAARHALSLAFAEARARAEGTPLYQSLGRAERVRSVPVNATLGADGTPAEVATRAREAVGEGYDCLKLKVGTNGIEEDIERARAVRTAVGDDVELRIDANGAWTVDQAHEALEAFGALDVSYVEQPLPTADLSAHARLRDGPVDVALDESLVGHDVDAILGADAADVLVLKPMVLGGPDRACAAANRCRDAGIDPVVSTSVDAVVARTAAVHVAASIPEVRPCGLATASLLATDLAPDPAPISDGYISVPQGAGLGFDERPT